MKQYLSIFMSALAVVLSVFAISGTGHVDTRSSCLRNQAAWGSVNQLIYNARKAAQDRVGTSKELPTDKKALVADTVLLEHIYPVAHESCN